MSDNRDVRRALRTDEAALPKSRRVIGDISAGEKNCAFRKFKRDIAPKDKRAYLSLARRNAHDSAAARRYVIYLALQIQHARDRRAARNQYNKSKRNNLEIHV